MSCKNLYFHSEALAKINCGGMCKRRMPVNLRCTKDEFKHLCGFYESPEEVAPVAGPVAEPVVEKIAEPVKEIKVEVDDGKTGLYSQHGKKHRGRPAIRRRS
jgi:hypothetical protein